MLPRTMWVMKAGTPHPHHLAYPCPSTPSLAQPGPLSPCRLLPWLWWALGSPFLTSVAACARLTMVRASWSSSLFPRKAL